MMASANKCLTVIKMNSCSLHLLSNATISTKQYWYKHLQIAYTSDSRPRTPPDPHAPSASSPTIPYSRHNSLLYHSHCHITLSCHPAWNTLPLVKNWNHYPHSPPEKNATPSPRNLLPRFIELHGRPIVFTQCICSFRGGAAGVYFMFQFFSRDY